MEVITDTHPWCLTTKKIRYREEFVTLADICKAASETDDPESFIRPYLSQLIYHQPIGRILVPRSKEVIRCDYAFWRRDTYWTTGLSEKASCLRKTLPGQNILGQLLFEVKVAPLVDHDYV